MTNTLLNQSLYPKDYRKEDVEKIVKHLITFQPLTIVGLPRVGLARILRFILVHPELLEQKLKSKVMLIEIDINDLFYFKESSLWQLVLKRLSDYANNDKVTDLYNTACQSNDVFTFFDNTKLAIKLLCENDTAVFLFFNRFDRIFSLYSYIFFAHFQSLKDVAKTKINFLFTSNRPLEFLHPEIFKGGNLEVFSQKYYLKPSSFKDLLPVINEFEKSRKINLNNQIKELVYQYSGGHSQYALLILQALEKRNFDTTNIDNFLKNDFSIIEQNKEFWDFLSPEEKAVFSAKKPLPNDHYLINVGLICYDTSVFSPLIAQFISSAVLLEKNTEKEPTKKEKLLLLILNNRKNNLVTREEIINFVWAKNSDEVNEWTLDQLVKRLRTKLSLNPKLGKIVTIKNQGYKLT